MRSTAVERLAIELADGSRVSALLCVPERSSACYVFAHGAGAGMEHPFMAAMAQDLGNHDVATLGFQFPFMERGSKRPDTPSVAKAAVRAAVAEAMQRLPGLPLFAGGKSFGGRMTSQAQSETPLHGVRGLVFAGFPLHPAGKPSQQRADHLSSVDCPMLFLQGTRDALAELDLVRTVVASLGDRATLSVFEDADHSFHVRARSGQTDAQVRNALVESMVRWFTAYSSARSPPSVWP